MACWYLRAGQKSWLPESLAKICPDWPVSTVDATDHTRSAHRFSALQRVMSCKAPVMKYLLCWVLRESLQLDPESEANEAVHCAQMKLVIDTAVPCFSSVCCMDRDRFANASFSWSGSKQRLCDCRPGYVSLCALRIQCQSSFVCPDPGLSVLDVVFCTNPISAHLRPSLTSNSLSHLVILSLRSSANTLLVLSFSSGVGVELTLQQASSIQGERKLHTSLACLVQPCKYTDLMNRSVG